MAFLNDMAKPEVDRSPASPFATYGFPLALLCAAAGILSGVGYRLSWWPVQVGFDILRWSAYVAIGAAVISLIGAVAARPGGKQRGLLLALLGLAISIAAFGWPATMQYRKQHSPLIHDITTDTGNPPKFVAVLPLRAGAANPPEYEGPEVAVQQRKAYLQLTPLDSKDSPERLFSRSLATARDMGWTIIAAVPAEGRIEATDTTLVYGFKDDVVIRVTPTANGSRVDIRSESRIGKSDMGTNARRVAAFLKKLAKSA
jgi:uncharacterized protein (DUF1499 family)